MIQLAHIALGALAGRHARTWRESLMLGVVTHALLDMIPHGEVHDEPLETISGMAAITSLALRHGWTSPITVGAMGGSIPDLEHVPRHVGIQIPCVFPTHRFGRLHGWEHTPLALPAWAQMIIGGAVVGALSAPAAGGTCESRSSARRRTRTAGTASFAPSGRRWLRYMARDR